MGIAGTLKALRIRPSFFFIYIKEKKNIFSLSFPLNVYLSFNCCCCLLIKNFSPPSFFAWLIVHRSVDLLVSPLQDHFPFLCFVLIIGDRSHWSIISSCIYFSSPLPSSPESGSREKNVSLFLYLGLVAFMMTYIYWQTKDRFSSGACNRPPLPARSSSSLERDFALSVRPMTSSLAGLLVDAFK